MNILDYALAKKLFGGSGSGEVSGTLDINENGTYNVAKYAHANVNVASSGGGESGVPIEVAELPTPTEQDVGKVYLNTTDGSYYVGEQGGSFAVGEPLGDKICFDTSANIADLGIPANAQIPIFAAQSDFAEFVIIVGEALGGAEMGNCYIVMCADMNAGIPIVVYAQCDVLTVDQFNEFIAPQMGSTITEFGWQTDVLDTSAYADCIVTENNLSSVGDFAYKGGYAFEKANEEIFGTEVNNLRSENAVLQEQYNEANNVAVLLENSARELYIPDNTTLENGILADCVNLAKISLPSISNIFYSAFGTNRDSVPTTLKTVNVRGGRISSNAFSYNDTLNTVILDEGVTNIDYQSFRNCTSLKSINIPDSVTTIGQQAFSNCWELPSLPIGSGVTTIGSNAFEEGHKLVKVIIKATTPPTLGSNAFYRCYHFWGTKDNVANPTGAKDGYIYVPDNLVEAYKSATNWSTYADQIKGISELPTEE